MCRAKFEHYYQRCRPYNHQIAISPIADESTTSHKPEFNSGTSSTLTARFNSNKTISTTSNQKTWQGKDGRWQAVVKLFLKHLNFPQRNLWNEHNSKKNQIRAIYLDTHRITVMNILNKAEKITWKII